MRPFSVLNYGIESVAIVCLCAPDAVSGWVVDCKRVYRYTINFFFLLHSSVVPNYGFQIYMICINFFFSAVCALNSLTTWLMLIEISKSYFKLRKNVLFGPMKFSCCNAEKEKNYRCSELNSFTWNLKRLLTTAVWILSDMNQNQIHALHRIHCYSLTKAGYSNV